MNTLEGMPDLELASALEIVPGLLMASREGVHVIDVRTPEEFFGPEGHLSGAKLASLGEGFTRFLDEALKDESYVFVCSHGKRSLQAVGFAKERGFSAVASLKGGIFAWRNAGFPLVFERLEEVC